jgi:hypothetical protein
MKNKWMTAAAVTVGSVVLLTSFAFASSATLRGMIFGKNVTALTDTQKADVAAYQEKQAALDKEFVNKMLANGTITQAEADKQIAQIDEALKSGDVKGLPGTEKGFGGRGEGLGGKGMGMFDTTTLTDAQKADLKVTAAKAIDNEKARLDEMDKLNLITASQATTMKANLDAELTDTDSDSFMPGIGFGRGMGAELRGITLTDAQKTALAVFDTKATEIRKEALGKLVKDGVLTQAQADSMATMANDSALGGKQMGGQGGRGGKGGMGRDGFEGGKGMRGNNPSNTPPSAAPNSNIQ